LEVSDQAPEWRRALAVEASTDRLDVLRQFQPALQLEGNANRGEAIFRKTCLHCHQLGDEGSEVGPQLASVTDKSPAALFHAVLDPNASVDARYYAYVVVSSDGRTFAGQLATETGSSITLLAAGGKRETILRRDIEELHASTKSLMPEGLEEGLTPQDLSDLLQFVRETFR
jgi:putative heme-binding domain-containing protein